MKIQDLIKAEKQFGELMQKEEYKEALIYSLENKGALNRMIHKDLSGILSKFSEKGISREELGDWLYSLFDNNPY